MDDLEAAPEIIRTKDIHLIDGPFTFPLREAIVRATAEQLTALVHDDLDRSEGLLEATPKRQLCDASTQTSGEQITPEPPTVQEYLSTQPR